MPTCKNCSSKTYTGNEPSPKGLGYCASTENEGVVMTGKNGANWEIRKMSNGVKRWFKTDKLPTSGVVTNISTSNVTETPKTKEPPADIKKLLEELNTLIKENPFIDYGDDLKRLYNLIEKIENNDGDTLNLVLERILQTSKHCPYSFEIKSGSILVSDPSYNYKKITNSKHQALDGNWNGYYQSWITEKKPNVMVTHHVDYPEYATDKLTYEVAREYISVDSGCVAIVDSKVYKSKGDLQVDAISALDGKSAGGIKNGYICQAGWGDGIYRYVIGKTPDGTVAQIMVNFMA